MKIKNAKVLKEIFEKGFTEYLENPDNHQKGYLNSLFRVSHFPVYHEIIYKSVTVLDGDLTLSESLPYNVEKLEAKVVVEADLKKNYSDGNGFGINTSDFRLEVEADFNQNEGSFENFNVR